MIRLDPKLLSCEASYFYRALQDRIIGQDRAIRTMVRTLQQWRAGFSAPGKPVANLLLLGPTGVGKTHLPEAVAEILFDDPKMMIKVDCAEYQRDHEISKLIGSPPGYVGREIEPVISNKKIEECQMPGVNLSLIVFDEIEKASPSLWQLLLGILDKAVLNLGDNTQVDLSQSIIFLTSNLASREIESLAKGGLGFGGGVPKAGGDADKRIYRTALSAASRNFSPEFMNRLDRVIVFHSLKHEHLEQILRIEINNVRNRIMKQAEINFKPFTFECTPAALDFLLREGTESRYGARPLKRAIERHLTNPLASLVATNQIEMADRVLVGYDEKEGLVFTKEKQVPMKLMTFNERL